MESWTGLKLLNGTRCGLGRNAWTAFRRASRLGVDIVGVFIAYEFHGWNLIALQDVALTVARTSGQSSRKFPALTSSVHTRIVLRSSLPDVRRRCRCCCAD